MFLAAVGATDYSGGANFGCAARCATGSFIASMKAGLHGAFWFLAEGRALYLPVHVAAIHVPAIPLRPADACWDGIS